MKNAYYWLRSFFCQSRQRRSANGLRRRHAILHLEGLEDRVLLDGRTLIWLGNDANANMTQKTQWSWAPNWQDKATGARITAGNPITQDDDLVFNDAGTTDTSVDDITTLTISRLDVDAKYAAKNGIAINGKLTIIGVFSSEIATTKTISGSGTLYIGLGADQPDNLFAVQTTLLWTAGTLAVNTEVGQKGILNVAPPKGSSVILGDFTQLKVTKTLSNQGTVNFTSGTIFVGQRASIENAGTFSVVATASTGSLAMKGQVEQAIAPKFINDPGATFSVTGYDPSVIAVDVGMNFINQNVAAANNGATIAVTSGQLRLYRSLDNAGTLNFGTGGELILGVTPDKPSATFYYVFEPGSNIVTPRSRGTLMLRGDLDADGNLVQPVLQLNVPELDLTNIVLDVVAGQFGNAVGYNQATKVKILDATLKEVTVDTTTLEIQQNARVYIDQDKRFADKNVFSRIKAGGKIDNLGWVQFADNTILGIGSSSQLINDGQNGTTDRATVQNQDQLKSTDRLSGVMTFGKNTSVQPNFPDQVAGAVFVVQNKSWIVKLPGSGVTTVAPGVIVNGTSNAISPDGTNFKFQGEANSNPNPGMSGSADPTETRYLVTQGVQFGVGSMTIPVDNEVDGVGTLSADLITNAGEVRPGDANSTAVIAMVGDFTQTADGKLTIKLGGRTGGSGYDQISVTGTITLSGNLNLSVLPNFAPTAGDTFTIIKNNGGPSVQGTFIAGYDSNNNPIPLAEGETITTSDGWSFRITYQGGTENDVVLTALATNPNELPTSVGLAASSATPGVGTNVSFTATVAGFATPTGSVTFFDGVTSLGSANLSGGSATFSTDTLTRGTHVITARYSGVSGDFAASASDPVTLIVGENLWTGSGGDGNWSTAGNWSNGSVPASGDDVVIPEGATVTLGSGTATVNSLTVDGALTVSGGSLAVNGDFVVDVGGSASISSGSVTVNSATVNGVLTLSGGSLDVTGDLLVTGGFDWTGGTFTVGGQFVIDSSGGGGTGIGATVAVSGQTLVNNGAFTLSHDSTLDLMNGSSFVNYGSFDMGFDALLTSSTGDGTFDNEGTFSLIGDETGTNAVVNLAFTNGGSMATA
jgi:hypothetical protein